MKKLGSGAFGEIYKGNTDNHHKLLKEYLEDYGPYLFKQKEGFLLEVTGTDLRKAASDAAETAVGMDQ